MDNSRAYREDLGGSVVDTNASYSCLIISNDKFSSAERVPRGTINGTSSALSQSVKRVINDLDFNLPNYSRLISVTIC